MLQSIRDRLTGPTVWFVVGLIAIPFAFWGIDSFRTGGGDPVVAEVGSEEITQTQFRRGYDSRYQQYRSLLGENFRADLFDQDRFRQVILDDMVQEMALQQHARHEGYRASDTTLRDFLFSIPAFQKDGQFSADTYKQVLSQQSLQPDRYEQQVRDSLVIDQIRDAVQDTAVVTDADTIEVLRLEQQKRRLAVAVIEAESFRDKIELREDQIVSRYDLDKSRFMSPERVKLAYVEIDRTKMVPAEAPPVEALRAIYDAEKDARFTSTEERKARHILIGFGEDKDAARTNAEELADKARGGADFAELATGNSTDTGSREQGGDLGWVRKGMMVPAFEDALFAMEPGATVGPIETEFGWHVIKLDEIKAVQTKAFEDAAIQEELLEVYRTREADRRFQEIAAKLEDLSFERPDLAAVASELGLAVSMTDWFTRAGGGGIASIEAVRTAAFSPDLLEENLNSKPISTGPESLVVVHKSEYEAARQKTLDEVRDEVRAVVLADEAAALARKAAEALLAAAQGGQGFAAAAAAQGASVRFDGEADRTQNEVDAAALAAAFKLPRPEPGAPQYQVVDLGGGSMAVVFLSAVIDPATPTTPADATAIEKKDRIRQSLAGAEYAAYRKSVETAVKVKIVNPPTAEPTSDPLEP